MESGAIADSQLTASSEYNAYHSTKRSRLHTKEISELARGAWVSSTNDGNQWLQIDVRKVLNVTHIATQGRNTYTPFQYVAKYKVQYSNDGQTFQFYKREGQPSDEVRNFCSFFPTRLRWWLKQFYSPWRKGGECSLVQPQWHGWRQKGKGLHTVCRTPHGNHPGTPSIAFSANIQY